jgi:hypothetical protein
MLTLLYGEPTATHFKSAPGVHLILEVASNPFLHAFLILRHSTLRAIGHISV